MKKAKVELLISVIVFGTIGLLRRYVSISSEVLAMFRGLIAGAFLFLFITLSKNKSFDKEAIKKNLKILILSGSIIGFNWIALFEAYNYTTIAKSTLCYYTEPVFVIIASSLLLKEKLSTKKIFCVIAALTGMVFVSGVIGETLSKNETLGIIYGLISAIMYATVTILNKYLKDIGSFDRAFVQLTCAGVVTIPYVLLIDAFPHGGVTTMDIFLILLMGVFYTGITYCLWFDAVGKLPAQTVAVLSYIDPVVAIICSALFLNEAIGLIELIGAILIIGSAIISEKGE